VSGRGQRPDRFEANAMSRTTKPGIVDAVRLTVSVCDAARPISRVPPLCRWVVEVQTSLSRVTRSPR